jgi:hypothetical protein
MIALPRESAPPRAFEPLPIDNTRGFPQSFSMLFEGETYHFRLYANLPAESLAGVEFLDLPSGGGHLVARVEQDADGGARRVLFLGKVVPELVYEVETIALEFPVQRVARASLNGQGDAGSRIEGRIARRWA